MRTIPSEGTAEPNDLTPDILQARLVRERQARAQAEALLEDKSRELYSSNTALRKIADAVESQRVQLDTILDYTLVGIVLSNSEMFVTRANRKAMALFGLSEDFFAELKIPELFEDFASVRYIVEESFGEGQKRDDALHETVGKQADGQKFPLEFGLAHMELDGRQHSVWIFRDITKRKLEEADRAKLEHELSQAQKLEALGTLASGVAHEINTPVQYISDNLRFLEDTVTDLTELINLYQTALSDLAVDEATSSKLNSLEAKAKKIDLEFLLEEAPLSIEQSLDGIKQVASIVNAIKEFSHPGEDEKSELDLNHAINNILTVTRNQWKYVAEIETELADALPAIQCLPGDINQVLLNLIVNAADAIGSSESGTEGKITIKTVHVDDHVVLSVGDNGSGMPDDIVDRIFDPFFTTKEVGKGTGQGLAIAYTIVKQKHKGEIECSSESGVGTIFTIRLPVVMHSNIDLEVA